MILCHKTVSSEIRGTDFWKSWHQTPAECRTGRFPAGCPHSPLRSRMLLKSTETSWKATVQCQISSATFKTYYYKIKKLAMWSYGKSQLKGMSMASVTEIYPHRKALEWSIWIIKCNRIMKVQWGGGLKKCLHFEVNFTLKLIKSTDTNIF